MTYIFSLEILAYSFAYLLSKNFPESEWSLPCFQAALFPEYEATSVAHRPSQIMLEVTVDWLSSLHLP